MVGDSLATDVRGAERAGLRAALLDRADEHRGEDVARVTTLATLCFVAH